MKSHILAAGVFVCSLVTVALAGQGNPMSNVLYDTAATANTLVMRDGSGNVAIVTADVTANVLDTSKVNFKTVGSVASDAIVCIMGGNLKQFGVCSGGITVNKCTCG